MVPDLDARAAVHAALGDPLRLALVEELARSDRTPSELGARHGLPSNLLVHHLAVLDGAGLVERVRSSGDGRRRYVRLRPGPLRGIGLTLPGSAPPARAVFVCTHNSARSQLAAALWEARTGRPGSSAGTRPASTVHPLAVRAARRAGLDLAGAVPRPLAPGDLAADLVVTVCDRAHEELGDDHRRLHWSVPDPAEIGRAAAFDATVAALDRRISALTGAEREEAHR